MKKYLFLAKPLLPYIALFFLLLPILFSVFRPGFWISDDGDWMVIRLAAFHQTLRAGQFPVRFLYSLNHGYGYPVLDFLYPLPFYLGEVVHLLGFGFVDSVRILFAASFVLGAVFMYQHAGLAAAIIYSYLPYRLFDVFSRGSLGEAVAFIFPPLIFQAIDKKKIFLASLATAALITSHNVIAFLFLPVIFLYSKSLRLLLFSALLSAWFWLPAIYDLQFTRAGQVVVSDFAAYFLRLSNFWSIMGPVLPLILVLSFFSRKTRLFLITALVAIFFALPISAPLWAVLPLPRLVQFPWRFLALAVFAVAVLASQLPWRVGILIAVITVLFSLPLLKVERTFRPDSYYATNDATTTVKNEYMPKWVRIDPQNRPLERQTVYFPGLKTIVNGQEVEPIVDDNGIVAGDVVFRETPVRLFADLLSLGALAALFLLWRKKPRFF